jgi:hypothetical protein
LTKTPLIPFPIKTNRDLLLFDLLNEDVLVVGCDSSGGIGPKPLDKIKVDGYTLGKFTARAALMEVLSIGANPICLVDALGVEAEPTGNEILKGIRDEAEKAGVDRTLAVTGSTEKNIKVEQTGIGVTVIGICKKSQLRIGTSKPNDIIVAVGVPRVGEEVLLAEKKQEIAETTDILRLQKAQFIHDIIPVGSTGASHEIDILAEGSKLRYKLRSQQEIDLMKSAGPATSILVTLPKRNLDELIQLIYKPLIVIADLTW